MKRTVELCYWAPIPNSSGGKYGHVGILFRAKNAKDNIYASYVLPPNIKHKCNCKKREYLLFHISTTLSADEDDTMKGREPNKLILVKGMDVSEMLLWMSKFNEKHKAERADRKCFRARYMKINVALLCARFWTVNCSDSILDDHEINHILTSGHSNCSTFAYALLRVGGIQTPDGVPKRHIILSVFCALCGAAQIYPTALFENIDVVSFSLNDVFFIAETFLLCLIPTVTVVAVMVSTCLNFCRKTGSIRTPESIYHLVRYHNDKKNTHRVRQTFGPNNKISAVLYTLLVLGVLADTILQYGGVYTEKNIGYSLAGDVFLLSIFASALVVDSLFESRCDRIVRRRNRGKCHVANTVGFFKGSLVVPLICASSDNGISE